jgi:class 3 adenylate cyclase
MAHQDEGLYDSDVVGEGGAGMERSTAIVVFTDLVGSTDLRSRLGEDAAEQRRRSHDRLVADAVEAHRGRLVKNLGDGVMATFTGASDALAAAVAIQQAIDREKQSGRTTCRWRCGSGSARATSPSRRSTASGRRSSRHRGCAPRPGVARFS